MLTYEMTEGCDAEGMTGMRRGWGSGCESVGWFSWGRRSGFTRGRFFQGRRADPEGNEGCDDEGMEGIGMWMRLRMRSGGAGFHKGVGLV